ncbi:hypothetical protein EYF80_052925 [Liparis tanakae]|uniref:Uncharacterized protein n=1 Tax=Liparis tanakae TaxID=230148 RepID=A0A4Z2F9D3_9TELE|nr:hypothetical protein EYF80_052925 [Liparis tanakae]
MLLLIFSQQFSMHSMQGVSSWYLLWGLAHYRILLLTGLLLRCSSQDIRKQPADLWLDGFTYPPPETGANEMIT